MGSTGPVTAVFSGLGKDLSKMKIKRLIVGILEANCYVLYQRAGGPCLLVDPGDEAPRILTFIRENRLEPQAIILTHNHRDHRGAVAEILAAYDVPVYLHAADAVNYRGRVDVEPEDGDRIRLEDEELVFRHTPGHSPGSVCLLGEKSRVCFTGDTLFDTDLGRTDLKGGSEAELARSIRDVVSHWPNDIMIYPGHDSGCTMKKVRIYNQEYLALTEGRERQA